MTPVLSAFVAVSAAMFAAGLGAVLARRHAIFILIGIELMLGAANLNFIAFWRAAADPDALVGVMTVLFAIGIAAAETALGLALVLLVRRRSREVDVDRIRELNG